jgi:ornithine racemase
LTSPSTPRIEIDLSKVAHNAEKMVRLYGSKGIHIMGVTKGVAGSAEVADILVKNGITTLADTKLKNLKTLKTAGAKAELVLLRTPALGDVEETVEIADISMNTELTVIEALSREALLQGKVHRIILMIEMGDLREGVMPADLENFIEKVLPLKGVKITGIGANFACFGGVKPSDVKMRELSAIAEKAESMFSLSLAYVTGGNSGNYHWFKETKNTGRINNLRVGESIYLGCETLDREEIPGLYTDAFTLVAEVIESKVKPSLPFGETAQNAAGEYPSFADQGMMRRAILAVGSQDVVVSGLKPKENIEILGSSSDHLIINAKDTDLPVGKEVAFHVNYSALLSLMASAYVSKKYYFSNFIQLPQPG